MITKEEALKLGVGTAQYWEAVTGKPAKRESSEEIPPHIITDKTYNYKFCFHCCKWILIEYWYAHFEGDCK